MSFTKWRFIGIVCSIIRLIPGRVLFQAPVVASAEVESRKHLLSSDWPKSPGYQKVTPVPAKCEMQRCVIITVQNINYRIDRIQENYRCCHHMISDLNNSVCIPSGLSIFEVCSFRTSPR